MRKKDLPEIHLLGLALDKKTTNADGQSAIDCGNLWTVFEKEKYHSRIKEKLSDEIFAVYHEYEGDHTQPFSYFIGCKVPDDAEVPEGMKRLVIPSSPYMVKRVKGKMPDCVIEGWIQIWNSSLPRAYKADFELYGEASKDWNQAEIDIYISIPG